MKNLSFSLLLYFPFFISCQENSQTQDQQWFRDVDNEMVIDLNNLTYTIANEHDHFYSFIGVRTLAMVHLAIHDIFNGAEPQFNQYHWKKNVKNANPFAAAVESTRMILTKAYPKRTDTIEAVCNSWLKRLGDTTAMKEGMMLGNEVAKAYLQLRDNDGHEKEGDYTPMTKPGAYQYTPGNNDWVLRPDFTVARTFTLDSLPQFRSPKPPSISSDEYLESYNEVKKYGAKDSKARTEDQTNYAHWWAEFGEHGWNRIGRITAKEENMPIIETNRMFALFNMTLYDLYLASLESKYYYDTWRPYTAIRNGEIDGNPDTQGDQDWEPEMQTPPWPEYPSAHAAVGVAGAEIFSDIYGTPDVSFTMESVTALPGSKIRSYNNLDSAAKDCSRSRIMNGFHFRFATEEGERQGRKIARHTLANYLIK
ncbi:vanadium-dependent haloperoxidase [soil metagenome]